MTTKRLRTKSLTLITGVFLLILDLIGCGNVGSHISTRPSAGAATTSATDTKVASAVAPVRRGLLGDGDADNPTDIDGDGDNPNNIDKGEYTDPDYDDDSKTRESYTYHDKDDSALLKFGHAAIGRNRREIATRVQEFYAAGASNDGAAACRLIIPSIARAIPESYGRAPGPPYLRGGKTCQAVMTLLFTHFRAQLIDQVKVSHIRINGNQARVFVGSTTMHASDITLERQGNVWNIEELFGNPLQ